MHESQLLHFAEHRLQEVALLIMATVYTIRLIWLFRFKAGGDRQAPDRALQHFSPEGRPLLAGEHRHALGHGEHTNEAGLLDSVRPVPPGRHGGHHPVLCDSLRPFGPCQRTRRLRLSGLHRGRLPDRVLPHVPEDLGQDDACDQHAGRLLQPRPSHRLVCLRRAGGAERTLERGRDHADLLPADGLLPRSTCPSARSGITSTIRSRATTWAGASGTEGSSRFRRASSRRRWLTRLAERPDDRTGKGRKGIWLRKFDRTRPRRSWTGFPRNSTGKW